MTGPLRWRFSYPGDRAKYAHANCGFRVVTTGEQPTDARLLEIYDEVPADEQCAGCGGR